MTTKVTKNNSRCVLITGLVLFFLIVMVTTVSADLRLIEEGYTVFIGESNLDITNAPFLPTQQTPSPIRIGWWASAAEMNACNLYSPIKTIDVTQSRSSFYVSPASFVGYPGIWYQLNQDNLCPAGIAFIVADPSLDMKIWNLNTNSDVTGQSIPATGAHLTFQINTNMYKAAIERNANPTTNEYITIKVKNEAGTTFTYLYKTLSDSNSLTDQSVNSAPWQWGGNSGDIYWATDLYAPGTYTVYAESNLNSMRDNYQNQGQDYTGKTISNTYTVTLTTPQGGVTCPGCSRIATVVTSSPNVTRVPVTTIPATTGPITLSVTPMITSTPVVKKTITTQSPQVTAVTTSSVEKLLEEQNKKIEEQNKLIAEQNKKIAEQSGLLNQILSYFKGIFGWK